MTCPNCGNENASGKFCTKCGTPLSNPAVGGAPVEPTQFNQPVNPTQYNQPNGAPAQQGNNEFIEKGKNVSKLYFSYFLNAIKQPASYAKTINGTQMINGIITMVLIALFLSLAMFRGIKAVMKEMAFFGEADVPFGEFFVKPLLYVLLYLAFISATIFGVLKVSKVQLSFQDVLARFGTYLVVPMVLFLLTLIAAFLGLGIEIVVFLVAFAMLALVLSIILTIYSFKERVPFGLDAFYGVLIVFLVIYIVNSLLGDAAFGDTLDMLDSLPF